jgi:hypothetical protein
MVKYIIGFKSDAFNPSYYYLLSHTAFTATLTTDKNLAQGFSSQEAAFNCLRMYRNTWANVNPDICADVFLYFKSRKHELIQKRNQ